MFNSCETPFYKTAFSQKPQTNQQKPINYKPNKKNKHLTSSYSSKDSLAEYLLKANATVQLGCSQGSIPNAGYNATVNYYRHDPSYTVHRKQEKTPLEDEKYYTDFCGDNLGITGLNYLNQMDKDLCRLTSESTDFKKTCRVKGGKPSYISQEEIEERKKALFGDIDKASGMLKKNMMMSQYIFEIYEKMSKDRDIDLTKIYNEDEELLKKIQKVIKNDIERQRQREAFMYAYSMKNMKKNIVRKGYTEPAPLSYSDKKFIRRYAHYLLFKKLKDNIIGTTDDDNEKLFSNMIFRNQFNNSNLTYKPDVSSFIAFCKLIFSILDKEKNAKINKQNIQEQINFDNKIITDLGFNDQADFNNKLQEFKKPKELLDERDFTRFLLSQSPVRDEIEYYLEDPRQENSECSEDTMKYNKKPSVANQDFLEVSDTDERTLPGLRTDVFNFLNSGNNKEKLDALNDFENDEYIKEMKANQIKNRPKILIDISNPDPIVRRHVDISYHEYLTFLRRYQSKDDVNFTIPEPFNFLKVNYMKHKLGKIREILEERVGEEEYLRNYKIKANELKPGIWGNQLEGFVAKDKEERKKRQDLLKEKIISEMKPFSFYERDERKYKQKLKNEYVAPSFPPFRANAIKWLSQLTIYEDMLAKEKKLREIRTKERMKKTANASRLPPRMALYEEAEKKKRLEAKRPKTPQKPPRFRANPVPDFKRLHALLDEEMETKKKLAFERGATQCVPFNFSQPKKNLEIRNHFDNENVPSYKNPVPKTDIKKIIQKMQRKPKIIPKKNTALDLLMDQRRKELEDKERRLKEKEYEDQLRAKRQDLLKERVQYSKALIGSKHRLEKQRQEKTEKFRKEMQNNRDTYIADLQRRLEKIYNRPLIFEQMAGKGEKNTFKSIAERRGAAGNDPLADLFYDSNGSMDEKREDEENEDEDKITNKTNNLNNNGTNSNNNNINSTSKSKSDQINIRNEGEFPEVLNSGSRIERSGERTVEDHAMENNEEDLKKTESEEDRNKITNSNLYDNNYDDEEIDPNLDKRNKTWNENENRVYKIDSDGDVDDEYKDNSPDKSEHRRLESDEEYEKDERYFPDNVEDIQGDEDEEDGEVYDDNNDADE